MNKDVYLRVEFPEIAIFLIPLTTIADHYASSSVAFLKATANLPSDWDFDREYRKLYERIFTDEEEALAWTKMMKWSDVRDNAILVNTNYTRVLTPDEWQLGLATLWKLSAKTIIELPEEELEELSLSNNGY